MVDIDLPGGGTLLHWMQTNMTGKPVGADPAGAGEAMSASTMVQGGTAAAKYIAPNPPAQAPLTHRYVQLLVNTTGAPAAANAALEKAAATRQEFSVEKTLAAAGLKDADVVGGNFFTVTNGK